MTGRDVFRNPTPDSKQWFYSCGRCGHVEAAWTRTKAEAWQDRHEPVCPNRSPE